jgi:16S rRNA (adenine1518-N6/adenine1519-N6)-dimethyltransferase
VLAELSGAGVVHLVSNLPYSVAVPVIVNCLLSSWRTVAGGEPAGGAVRFDRLTFTVQRELAQRLTARPGGGHYGPASVIVSLLSRATLGREIPPTAFWPRPKVRSQMVRLDFDAAGAARLADAGALSTVLSATFGLRRKKLSAAARCRGFPYEREAFLSALAEAGVDARQRPEQVGPQGFLAVANVLHRAP